MAVYCHPVYLTYMQSTSGETLDWKKHKPESRLPGEISITSDMQMSPPLWQKLAGALRYRAWAQSWSSAALATRSVLPSNRPATPLFSPACWEPGIQAWAPALQLPHPQVQAGPTCSPSFPFLLVPSFLLSYRVLYASGYSFSDQALASASRLRSDGTSLH